MPTRPYRFQLSLRDRLRRSMYEVLRDQLDVYLVKHALIDSYRNFRLAGKPYPFVSKRELKPRARIVEKEHIHHNHFLVLFCEGTIPGHCKKYIRFFDSNKVTKDGIEELADIQLHRRYTKNLRFFDNPGFENLVLDLLSEDYSLLIQKSPLIRRKNRYAMTHFRVKIDWPIDDATEAMARELRYVSQELYENGEKYAQSLQNKFFESCGFYHRIGGRRTAAIVAAQFLKNMDFISTVYVASSEDRTLTRIAEQGVNKFVLIRLPMVEASKLAEENRLSLYKFVDRYMVDTRDDYGVGIFQVVYNHTVYSRPPEDGRLRALRPDVQWLSVSNQLLMPLPEHPKVHPLPYSTIYTSD